MTRYRVEPRRYFVHLSIPGEPVALARARKGKNGRWYTPTTSAEAEQQIALAWKASGKPAVPAGVPLKLTIGAYYKVPRKPARPYPSRGDLDNCIKLACDALQKAGAFANDSQIVEIEAGKCFDDAELGPSLELELMEVDPST